MDAYDCVRTKLDLREFDQTRKIPSDAKMKILESARVTGSAMNSQHWRIILVQTPERMKTLAEDSTTGSWIRGANFAVIVLTGEKHGFELIDAGRVIQDMQIAAWNLGIVSCIFTGVNQTALRRDFSMPQNLVASVVVGFGYPAKRVTGEKKKRKPLTELVFMESYGKPFDKEQLS
ncbi:MAG: nitroreductase family protein [Candidatus Bathyarchaeia archaeon]|jgi:nitroreductase